MKEIIVTGGRNYEDEAKVFAVLSALNPSVVIHGDCTGADEFAHEWAYAVNCAVKTFPADWANEGRSAGPKRNARMLDAHPNALVIAFPGGAGTANCVSQALARGMLVLEVKG